jgi:hypothetical protein
MVSAVTGWTSAAAVCDMDVAEHIAGFRRGSAAPRNPSEGIV